MASIAKLAAKVTANATQFDTVFDGVGKTFTALETRVKRLQSPFIKLRSLVAVLGATLAVGYVTEVARASVETLQLARRLDDASENIYALREGMRLAGGDASTIDNALEGLVKTLASATQGNSVAAETFSRLGLSADKLSKMRPSDAFREIAEQISKIEDANVRAAFATQIFGDDAAALLPLLSQGAAGIDKAAKAAAGLGKNLNNDQLTAIEQAKIAVDGLEQAFEGVALQVASRIAPWLEVVLKDVLATIGGVDGLADIFKDTGKYVAYLYVFAHNFFQVIKIGFQIGKLYVDAFGAGLAAILEVMFKIQAATSRASGFDKMAAQFDDYSKQAKATRNEFIAAGRADVDAINKTRREGFKGFDEVDNILAHANAAGEKRVDQANKIATAYGSVAKAFANSELFKKGLEIANEVKSPFQAYIDRMTQLEELLKVGAISWDTYALAVAKAAGELENAYQIQSTSLAASTKGGTSDAVSAVNRSRAEYEAKNTDPRQRLEKLQKEANGIAKDTRDAARKLADAAQDMKVVSMK